MNAYELAKAQQAYSPPTLEEIIKQQADRIKELEAWQKHDLELAEATGFERAHKLQADRIAELEKEMKYDVTIKWDDKITHQSNVNVNTPLHYTTPQTKPLSDEEITAIYKKVIDSERGSWHEFARAIEERILGK